MLPKYGSRNICLEMKNMPVLNERLSMASSLSDDKAVELDALADALVDSIQA